MKLSEELSEVFESYLSELAKSLEALDLRKLGEIGDLLYAAWKNDRTIFIFGNGDSATNALHYALEFCKEGSVPGKKKAKAMCLNENISLMTALSNDVSYDAVFKNQLENFVEKGDVVIGISGSGNSPNVLQAIEYANSVGAQTVGLTAFDGGILARLAKHSLVVQSHNMERAEDVHWIIGHMLRNYLKKKVAGG